jgi:hypothetical protein
MGRGEAGSDSKNKYKFKSGGLLLKPYVVLKQELFLV